MDERCVALAPLLQEDAPAVSTLESAHGTVLPIGPLSPPATGAFAQLKRHAFTGGRDIRVGQATVARADDTASLTTRAVLGTFRRPKHLGRGSPLGVRVPPNELCPPDL